MAPSRPPGRCQWPLDGVNGRRPLPQAGSARAGSACRKLARPAAAQAQPDGSRRAWTRLAGLRVRPARRGWPACAELRQEPRIEPVKSQSGASQEFRQEARLAARAAGCRRPVYPFTRSAVLPVLTTGRQVGKKGRVEAISIFSRLLSPRDRLSALRASHAARPADAEGLARACAPACPQRQARNGIP